MKKSICLFLTLVLLVSLAAPAFAAGEQPYPMIYLEGQGIYLETDDGTLVYNVEPPLMDRVTERMNDIGKYLVLGNLTGNFSKFNDTLYEIIAPVYAAEKLGNDGMPRDGSHVTAGYLWRGKGKLSNIEETIPLASGGSYPVYRWHYDWRLSPITLAEELNDLIDAVLEKTGAQKVNLVSRCLATNIVYAYLYQYGPDKVNASVFYTSALKGIGTATAAFTGDFVVDEPALERFLTYYRELNNLVIRDEPTTELLMALVSVMVENKTLGLAVNEVERGYRIIRNDVMPRILRDSFATFPSYWSMVSAESYEKARAFVFGGVEDEWAGLLEKTDAYYEMQKEMDSYLLSISDKVHIGFVSKYGLPCFPLSDDAAEEGDVYVATSLSSQGATCADVDKTLSDAYLKEAVRKGTAKYISADCKVDASTALFPDTTWFVKDLYHTYFPDCVNDLCVAFVNNNEMTVNSDPAFTQYLQFTPTNNLGSDYTTGILTPIRTMDDTHDSTQTYSHTFWSALVRFFKAFGAFIKSLFQ